MASVNVGVRDLRQSANAHWQAKLKLSDSGTRRGHHLLAFYALECAMKAHVLDERRLHSTEHLVSGFGNDHHDLHEGMKTCRVPALYGAPPSVHREDGDQVPTSKLHQAWRYGAKLKSSDEEMFAAWLTGIYNWLKEVKR